MPHGMMFCGRAEEYSCSKLKGVPSQVVGSVVMNPLAADAIMKPLCAVDRSITLASSACPPGTAVSNRCTLITSPGFISRVCALGVTEARSASCGLGGPVGTPVVWMKAPLTGSVQFGLHDPL